jgi:hypothetical protein
MDLIPFYYHRVMAGVGKPTFKMREALAAQDLIESLEMRRTLARVRLGGRPTAL